MKFSVKTIKTICAVVAALVAATAFGSLTTNHTVRADESVGLKYEIDTGDFTLKTDDSVSIDVSYEHGAYLYNKRETSGNIRLGFKTVSYSHSASGAYNGLVRGYSSDVAYGYVPLNANYWYVFGNGTDPDDSRSLYSVGEYTDVLYDASAHAFTVKIGDNTPVMSKMFQAAEASVADASSPKRVAWDVNNAEDRIVASLTDFSISDEEGYYLGVAMSRTVDSRFEYTLEEKIYGYANKIVTVKYTGKESNVDLRIYGEDGKTISTNVTNDGNGVFSFVMPSCNVRLATSYEISKENVYGTYRNEETGCVYVLGEISYKSLNGVKNEISYTAYSDGTVKIEEGGLTYSAAASLGNIAIDNVVYKKLLKYTVKFVADGKTVDSVTLSSGDYTVTAPAAPVKEGYVFSGWKNGKGETFDETKTVTASATYYATFTEEGGHVDPTGGGGCGSSAGISVSGLPLAAIVLFLQKKRKGLDNSK